MSTTEIAPADLLAAQDGSYYTIVGAGGDLNVWIDGYEEELAKAGIGKPVRWFTTTGKDVNEFSHAEGNDRFPSDLTFLLFPLDGLAIGKLSIFKLQWQDRWFDDIVMNIRERGLHA